MNALSMLLNIGRRTLDKAPCLAPWYFKESQTKLLRDGVLLTWKFVENIDSEFVGTFTLQRHDEECLGLLNIYTYILPGPKKDSFLVWSRYHPADPSTIDISLYETSQLQPIENFRDSVFALRDDKSVTFRFNANQSGSISFTTSNDGEHDLLFPEGFEVFEDFCVVDEIPGIYGSCDSPWKSTCIIKFCPRINKVMVYPQDWFNKSDYDFGYQWITRAAINGISGRIHGQGIRLDNFVLDKTNRNIKRWWIV